MTSQPEQMPAKRGRLASMLLLPGLLLLFVLLSGSAVATKSATYDEPMHALAGWVNLTRGDLRMNHESPVLWKYWAALPNLGTTLELDHLEDLWRSMAPNLYRQWPFTVEALYRTAGNDGVEVVWRSRLMMLALGAALGLMIWIWARRLGGPVAAACGLGLFALDPNLLGHAPLVKNDVAFALVTLALCYALWRLGERITPWSLLRAALTAALALNVKYTALALLPIAALLLLLRALLGGGWVVSRRVVATRGRRLALAAALVVGLGGIGWLSVWACYGWRYRAIPGGPELPTARYVDEIRFRELTADPGRVPTARELAAWRPGPAVRAILWADQRRLAPEAWTHGLLQLRAQTTTKEAYLLGERSLTGWWYYFPLALAFKAPLALLAAALAALAGMVLLGQRRDSAGAPSSQRGWRWWWSGLCIGVPPVILFVAAMGSNLNIGVRHVLVVLPFAFVGIGLAAAALVRRWRRVTTCAIAALALGLAAESLAAHPDYIAFFNAAAGGPRGGLQLLGDSNLDWGQDLPRLAAWRRGNAGGRLYLSYFGTADPAAYEIDYSNFPGGYPFGPVARLPSQPGVIAVSATNLQGIYLDSPLRPNKALRALYRRLRQSQPITVLGGTIYLYRHVPTRQGDR